MTPIAGSRGGRPIGQPDDRARVGNGGNRGARALVTALAAAILFCVPAGAADLCDFDWLVPVTKVVRVIDGDTIEADLSPWVGTTVRARLRLARVDCPEIHAKDEGKRKRAQAAKDMTSSAMGSEHVVIAPLGKADSFGRVLCEVFFYAGNGKMLSLGDELVRAGLAELGYDPGRF